jgi:hypothetical protein
MISPLFLRIPEPNYTGIQRHRTLGPHVLNAAHPGNGLIRPGRMCLPLARHLGQLNRLLRRQHVGFERDDDIDLALALQCG